MHDCKLFPCKLIIKLNTIARDATDVRKTLKRVESDFSFLLRAAETFFEEMLKALAIKNACVEATKISCAHCCRLLDRKVGVMPQF